MTNNISVDGICMRVIKTAPKGVVNVDTLFEFSQSGNIVSAKYSGGGIRAGRLVGVIKDKKLLFRYAQLEAGDKLAGGHSECDICRNAEGLLQLHEHFSWESRDGSGTNIFEEIG